jgi:hypothetical protein
MLTLTPGKSEYTFATHAQLKRIPVPPQGSRTDRWQGIQHAELVDVLAEVIGDRIGKSPVNPQFAVSPNGAAMIGSFDLQPVKKGKPKKTDKMIPTKLAGVVQPVIQSVGFSHSNDSRKALRLALGSRVLICSNGMVFGEMSLKHKHTNFRTNQTLKDWLGGGLERIFGRWDNYAKVARMLAENKFVSPTHYEGAILDLARPGYVPYKMLEHVERDWRIANGFPHYFSRVKTEAENWEQIDKPGARIPWVPEGTNPREWKFDGSLMDWYNCVTHTCKLIPPADQLQALEGAFNVAAKNLPAKAAKEAQKILDSYKDN